MKSLNFSDCETQPSVDPRTEPNTGPPTKVPRSPPPRNEPPSAPIMPPAIVLGARSFISRFISSTDSCLVFSSFSSSKLPKNNEPKCLNPPAIEASAVSTIPTLSSGFSLSLLNPNIYDMVLSLSIVNVLLILPHTVLSGSVSSSIVIPLEFVNPLPVIVWVNDACRSLMEFDIPPNTPPSLNPFTPLVPNNEIFSGDQTCLSNSSLAISANPTALSTNSYKVCSGLPYRKLMSKPLLLSTPDANLLAPGVRPFLTL